MQVDPMSCGYNKCFLTFLHRLIETLAARPGRSVSQCMLTVVERTVHNFTKKQ